MVTDADWVTVRPTSSGTPLIERDACEPACHGGKTFLLNVLGCRGALAPWQPVRGLAAYVGAFTGTPTSRQELFHGVEALLSLSEW